MSKEKESTTKKLGRFLGKKVVDAGHIIDREIRKAGKTARDEFKEFDITNVTVEPPKKPKGESIVHFTRRARPTKTYTQANRTVQFFSRNPEKKEMNPGIDGLVSFSILIVPFAVLIGALIIMGLLDEPLAIILLILYAILIAIPGAYLGLDAIFDGARAVIKGGTTTLIAIFRGFIEFISLMIQGIAELCLLLLNGLFGFAKGAFDTLADYVVFIGVYTLFAVGIYFLLQVIEINQITNSFIILGFLVLLPALLPASIAHRYWLLWRLNRQTAS
ncbi:MAG: hypothetical protein JSW11_21090 [Candidatus Heimdallarchaeota archaeon]|nr:MAG: hypothetical protein JSW11_21090 [Candidatus Heimdallarchaeota archaeon]